MLLAPQAGQRLPPLLDPEIKKECACNPAPIAIDERAIEMGIQCAKCGHEVKLPAFIRLVRNAQKI